MDPEPAPARRSSALPSESSQRAALINRWRLGVYIGCALLALTAFVLIAVTAAHTSRPAEPTMHNTFRLTCQGNNCTTITAVPTIALTNGTAFSYANGTDIFSLPWTFVFRGNVTAT